MRVVLKVFAMTLMLGMLPSSLFGDLGNAADPANRSPAPADRPEDAGRIPAGPSPGQGGLLSGKPTSLPDHLVSRWKNDKDAPTILHEPIQTAEKARALLVFANVVDPSGIKFATLYYRAGEGQEYTALAMNPGADRVFKALIPSEAMKGFQVAYYLEAGDYQNNGPARLGTPEQPFLVTLVEPAAAPTGKQTDGLMMGLAAFLIAAFSVFSFLLVMVARDRKHQVKLKDELFWEHTLFPLLKMPEEEASLQVTELSTTPLMHPVLGTQVFSVDVIEGKLSLIRQVHQDKDESGQT